MNKDRLSLYQKTRSSNLTTCKKSISELPMPTLMVFTFPNFLQKLSTLGKHGFTPRFTGNSEAPEYLSAHFRHISFIFNRLGPQGASYWVGKDVCKAPPLRQVFRIAPLVIMGIL